VRTLASGGAAKRAREEGALEQAHGGKDALAAHRLALAAAEARRHDVDEAERLFDEIAALAPGARSRARARGRARSGRSCLAVTCRPPLFGRTRGGPTVSECGEAARS